MCSSDLTLRPHDEIRSADGPLMSGYLDALRWTLQNRGLTIAAGTGFFILSILLLIAVPKAFIVLASGQKPDRDTALALFRHAREHLSPFKRIRRIEFADLPKTISGKIRRVELRRNEAAQRQADKRGTTEFWEEDFPELK